MRNINGRYNNQLMNFTECPICLTEYDEVQHIPYDICQEGHTLCKLCLTSIKKSASPLCPICRNTVEERLNRFAVEAIQDRKKRLKPPTRELLHENSSQRIRGD